MKAQKDVYNLKVAILFSVFATLSTTHSSAQQVEVQGALKVTQMTTNDTQDKLVIHNTDGTFGDEVSSLLATPTSGNRYHS